MQEQVALSVRVSRFIIPRVSELISASSGALTCAPPTGQQNRSTNE